MSFEKIHSVRNREEIKRAESAAKVVEIQQNQDLKYKKEMMEMQAEIQSRYNQNFGGIFNQPNSNEKEENNND